MSAHGFSLSGDGRQLAYSVFTYTGNVWMADIPQRGPLSAAEPRRFTEGTQVIEGLSLSPDGRWLAFDSDRNGNQEIYKVSVDGGEPVQLTNSPEDDFVSSWSGNGREIAACIAVAAAVMILRKTHPELLRVLRCPAPMIVAPLAIIGCLYLFVSLKPMTMGVFFGWNIVGLLFYLAYGRARSHARIK